jgi:hypothetical protein
MNQWSVRAVNLPEHQNNRIHTDEGAREAGFGSALVAGVTVYAYLTHPVVAADPGWVAHGAGEVRFFAPVEHAEEVFCTPTDLSENESDGKSEGSVLRSPAVVARVGASHMIRAQLRLLDSPVFSDAEGDPLNQVEVLLDDTIATYGPRAGDDLVLYTDGIVHPCIWPSLANRVFHEQLVEGSWIHTRSLIQHHRLARVGEQVRVTGRVQRRFTKPTGDRAIARIAIVSENGPIATLEHEAIVKLPS